MELSSLLANLIIPLDLCIALLVLGAVLRLLRLRRAGNFAVIFGLAWALAWSLPITSIWLGGALEQRYPHLTPTAAPKAEAIVVLGGNIAHGRSNWFLPLDKETAVERMDVAIDLYEAGRASKIVLSGGALTGDVSEARSIAHRMLQNGIPKEALILENSSRTTHENATLTEDELELHDIHSVLLVTSALHMPRAMAAFAKQGVQAVAAPTPAQIALPADGSISPWMPNQRAFEASRAIIKEYAGLLVYWWRGWV